MILNYHLSKEEIEQAFQCVSWRANKRLYDVHILILTVIGVGILLAYIADPDKFYLFILLFLVILLLLIVIYLPPSRRKKKVCQMVKREEKYRLEIRSNSIVCGNNKNIVPLVNKKLWTVYTKEVCVLWVEKDWYIIPRRILDQSAENELRKILEDKNCHFIYLTS